MDNLTVIKKNFSIAIIPFVFLLVIGLLPGNITYHQKTFKTLLIICFVSVLTLIYIVNILDERDYFAKQKKFLLYFLAYFSFALFQYIVSFLSKEVSYDRDYHLSNYTSLIIMALFFYLYIKTFDELKIGLLLINIFFLIVLCVSFYDFVKEGSDFSHFRPKLSFGNTDYFSGYAIGLYPLALLTPLIWYDREKKFSENYFTIITFIIGILGCIPIIFSQTKAALIGIYIGLFVLGVPSLVIMQKKIPLVIKLLIAVFLMFFFLMTPLILLKYPPEPVKFIFNRLVVAMDNPIFFIKDRLNGWAGGLGLFKAHPIFGAGLGTVYAASFKYINKFFLMYSPSNSFKHSHSEFVEVLGETGIFGMSVFLFLLGFVIVSLFIKAYSSKYDYKYRLAALGVSLGLISMMIHQVFSLSLRMSVTMTAYFSLLGIGIFIISYSQQALIVTDTKKKSKKELKNEDIPESFLSGELNRKSAFIMSGIIVVLLIISFSLFLPVFKSEVYIIKNLNSYELIRKSRTFDEANYYLTKANDYLIKAVTAKPDNPYAWTQKWTFDANINLRGGLSNQVDENYFEIIKKDLDKLNSIIPGYQDVWSKYANYYLTRFDFYRSKWRRYQNTNDLVDSQNSIKEALVYLDKSLDMNYLNLDNHIYKLIILSYFDNKNQYIEAMKDYFNARIYLDCAKQKKLIKEKIDIVFGNENKIEKINGVYHFTINREEVVNIAEKSFSAYRDLSSLNQFNNQINQDFIAITSPLFEKIVN